MRLLVTMAHGLRASFSKHHVTMEQKEFSFRYKEVADISLLPEDEQELVRISREMTHQSYAPYSTFYVGAAILLDNGEIIKGSNQENGAYPSGLCAERVAAFAASATHPGTGMIKIAVSARSVRINMIEPVTPCGSCRQVLLEYETLQKHPMKVILSKEDGKILILDRISDLLPLFFNGNGLKKTRE